MEFGSKDIDGHGVVATLHDAICVLHLLFLDSSIPEHEVYPHIEGILHANQTLESLI